MHRPTHVYISENGARAGHLATKLPLQKRKLEKCKCRYALGDSNTCIVKPTVNYINERWFALGDSITTNEVLLSSTIVLFIVDFLHQEASPHLSLVVLLKTEVSRPPRHYMQPKYTVKCAFRDCTSQRSTFYHRSKTDSSSPSVVIKRLSRVWPLIQT